MQTYEMIPKHGKGILTIVILNLKLWFNEKQLKRKIWKFTGAHVSGFITVFDTKW